MTYAAYYTSDSLPLAWDKLKGSGRSVHYKRFTSTRVEQTKFDPFLESLNQIHSHSRGTIIYRQDINIQSPVSFPRMWDKPVPQSFPCIHARLIPRALDETIIHFCSYNLEATCNSTQHHHTQDFFSQKLYISVSPLSIIDS